MKILCTGCYGFVGSKILKKLLDDGHYVVGCDDSSLAENTRLISYGIQPKEILPGLFSLYLKTNKKKLDSTRIVEGDFACNPILDAVSASEFDVVIHCAANPSVPYSVSHPDETFENNVSKTQKLALACANGKTRLVFSSSSAAYGDADVVPTPETLLSKPLSPYGLHKLQSEQLIQMYVKHYNLDAYCLRYFNVYGPDQDGTNAYCTVIARWCQAIAENRSIVIEGTGESSRDFIYVDDVVNANMLAALNKKRGDGSPINICTGLSVCLLDLLSLFELHLGRKIDVRYVEPRPGDPAKTCGDNTKAIQELGFGANVLGDTNIHDGLRKTLEYWKL